MLLQSKEWSEKIQIMLVNYEINQIGIEQDFQIVENMCFFRFMNTSICLAGVINLDTGEIENLKQLTLPSPWISGRIHVSKYAVFTSYRTILSTSTVKAQSK